MKAYLDPEDIVKMEAAATSLRDRLFIRVSFRTGCRVSEVVGLAVEDCDLEAATVRVIRQKEKLQLYCGECSSRLGRSHRFCPGCGREVTEAQRRLQETRRRRVLPLDQETVEMLRDFIDGGGPVMKNGKLVLFGIGRSQAWRVVSRAARRTGLGPLVHPESGRLHGVSPHRLRDAFAVNAVKHDDSGDGLRLLQEHLGHASFNTTARYRKVGSEEQRQWYQKLWAGPPEEGPPKGRKG